MSASSGLINHVDLTRVARFVVNIYQSQGRAITEHLHLQRLHVLIQNTILNGNNYSVNQEILNLALNWIIYCPVHNSLSHVLDNQYYAHTLF